MYLEGFDAARIPLVVFSVVLKHAYAVDSAFFPVYEMDFIELATPIMARENY